MTDQGYILNSLRVQMLGLYVKVSVHFGSKDGITIKSPKIQTGPLVTHQGVLGAKTLPTLKAVPDDWLFIGLLVIIYKV